MSRPVLRILFLTQSFNSLAQRLFVELGDRGHEVAVELDINDAVTTEAIERFGPDLILAPFLMRRIPEDVWRRVPCLIVHPGIKGDRGPSALDWAIAQGEATWGVTLLQANAEMDGGAIWAAETFPLRAAAKSDIYRREVAQAATAAVLGALERLQAGTLAPEPLDYGRQDVLGRPRPAMRQADRAIDWAKDSSDTVVRKIRAADSNPGVLDYVGEHQWYLFGAHAEDELAGPPGAIVAQRDGAICRATRDGAIWITHLKAQGEFGLKLPATLALGSELGVVPEIPVPLESPRTRTFREITYREAGPVGFLAFEFYNGAMSTGQCRRLLAAYRAALERPTRVLVLLGGEAFWSNGIHLNVIEAAESPADESWANIAAMDDLAAAVIGTGDRLIIAALRGNAAAGGVFLALAADRVIAHEGIVLNPHYKGMGNLYGSEYWTYLLPGRVGERRAGEIAELHLPVSTRRALELGLVDDLVAGGPAEVMGRIGELAQAWARSPDYDALLAAKRLRRARDEAVRPLDAYREAELDRMKQNFYGFDPSYHVARYNFVHKVPHSRTPSNIATHRRIRPRVSLLLT